MDPAATRQLAFALLAGAALFTGISHALPLQDAEGFGASVEVYAWGMEFDFTGIGFMPGARGDDTWWEADAEGDKAAEVYALRSVVPLSVLAGGLLVAAAAAWYARADARPRAWLAGGAAAALLVAIVLFVWGTASLLEDAGLDYTGWLILPVGALGLAGGAAFLAWREADAPQGAAPQAGVAQAPPGKTP